MTKNVQITKKRSFLQRLARGILQLLGWTILDNLPQSRKYVIISANHTSNWDFPLALVLAWALGIKLHWVGKDSLFRWPFKGIMIALGGIPVVRSSSNNFVQQMVAKFAEYDELALAIAPDGTRGNADYWRTGFYYIALGAKVPLALAVLDYGRKRCGFETSLMPSGDLLADIELIRDYYADKKGKVPHKQGEVRVRLPVTVESKGTVKSGK